MNLSIPEAAAAFVADYSKAVGVTADVFVSNLVTDCMARIAAAGLDGDPHLFPPFARDAGGVVMEDKELFFYLLNLYQQRARREAADRDAALGLLHEATKARLAAGARLRTEIERGRVPADYSGAPENALTWLDELDRGEISADQLAERFEAHRAQGGWSGGEG